MAKRSVKLFQKYLSSETKRVAWSGPCKLSCSRKTHYQGLDNVNEIASFISGRGGGAEEEEDLKNSSRDVFSTLGVEVE